MSEQRAREVQQDRFTVAKMFRIASKAHTWLPYYFARNGYAFPVWHYYLEVTRCCNLRCAMCQYITWLKNTPVSVQRQGELTTEEWFRVIDQVPRLCMVTFTGGEPLLREDFLQLLERASARTRTHVITNAVLLSEEYARQCVACAPRRFGGIGFNFAGVSLEGPAEVHDEIRMMRGAFERSSAGVRALIAFRKQAGKACPLVHVTTVIQERNVDVLAQMPRICAELGADVLNLTIEVRNFAIDGLGDTDPSSYDPSEMIVPRIDPARLAQALKDTRAAAHQAGIELRTPDMPDAEIVRYYRGEMDLRDFRCGGIWTNVAVSAKGDVYPCWLMKGANVRDKTLKAIWNDAQTRAFRRKTRDGLYPPCLGCCFLVHKK